ncbi:MAG: hypothetical protein BGN86_11735 [Caulobacterales bacterium 68-7]|nr:MAG: hypothetical protein BGN86_11735 [Caulobacterales bacterium 68-7]
MSDDIDNIPQGDDQEDARAPTPHGTGAPQPGEGTPQPGQADDTTRSVDLGEGEEDYEDDEDGAEIIPPEGDAGAFAQGADGAGETSVEAADDEDAIGAGDLGEGVEPEADPSLDRQLDKGLKETFPASDPVSISPGAD